MGEEIREEFEAAVTKDREEAGYDEPNLDMHEWEGTQCYVETHIQAAWWGWQASRAALVVELPEKISQYNTDDCGFINPAAAEHDEAIDDCREAIEAAGIKVKS